MRRTSAPAISEMFRPRRRAHTKTISPNAARAMQVEYLADHRDRLQEVAELHHGEWPSPELGDSIEARERILSTCCRRGEIPLGLIALDQNALFETLYLYTAHSETLYGRFGWKVLERCFHNNRNYAVMSLKQTDPPVFGL
jgi:hypothetical protein